MLNRVHAHAHISSDARGNANGRAAEMLRRAGRCWRVWCTTGVCGAYRPDAQNVQMFAELKSVKSIACVSRWRRVLCFSRKFVKKIRLVRTAGLWVVCQPDENVQCVVENCENDAYVLNVKYNISVFSVDYWNCVYCDFAEIRSRYYCIRKSGLTQFQVDTNLSN